MMPKAKERSSGIWDFSFVFWFSSASPVVVAVDWRSKGKIGGGMKENIGGKEGGGEELDG